jgi:hypothetical protein
MAAMSSRVRDVHSAISAEIIEALAKINLSFWIQIEYVHAR